MAKVECTINVRDIDEVKAALAERERFRDALDHIMRTTAHSRTQTKRLRFIRRRAELALKGESYHYAKCELPQEVEPVNYAAVDRQLRFLKRDRDALAAHAERLEALLERAQKERIPDYCNLDEDIDTAMDDAPQTSLAQREARMKAEALDKLSDDFYEEYGGFDVPGYRVINWIDDKCDEYRQQAEENN